MNRHALELSLGDRITLPSGGTRRLVAHPSVATGPGEGPAEPIRVLVVEDEYVVAAQIEAALADAGFEVVGIAATGEEAIAIAAEEKPAIAVVDIRLAGVIDGVEAAVALYKDHGIRSIFATAHYDNATRTRAEAASPLGWLPKPYRMENLVTAVRNAVQRLN